MSADPPPAEPCVEGFRLRRVAAPDWPLVQLLSRDPEVVRWTFYPADMDDEAAQRHVGRSLERDAAGTSRRYVLLAGSEALGMVGVACLDSEVPEVFYALLPAARGRGAATASVVGIAQWLLRNGWRSVALMTVEGNLASEAVARRSGFDVEGRHRGDHRGEDVLLTRWLRSAR